MPERQANHPLGCHAATEAQHNHDINQGKLDMLTWAIIALVIAVIAGALGFTGVAATAGTVAKVLFGIFLVIALVLFVLGAVAV